MLLELLILILVLMWILGYGALHMTGLIHLLLIVALVVLIFRLVQGRGP